MCLLLLVDCLYLMCKDIDVVDMDHGQCLMLYFVIVLVAVEQYRFVML